MVNPMHITASVFINDDERGLLADYEDWLGGWRSTRRSASAGPEAGCTTARARTPVLNEVTGTLMRTRSGQHEPVARCR